MWTFTEAQDDDQPGFFYFGNSGVEMKVFDMTQLAGDICCEAMNIWAGESNSRPAAVKQQRDSAIADLAASQQEIARLRAALEPNRSGPAFYDWLADRLVHQYGEDPNVDFVLTLRRRAALGREALNK